NRFRRADFEWHSCSLLWIGWRSRLRYFLGARQQWLTRTARANSLRARGSIKRQSRDRRLRHGVHCPWLKPVKSKRVMECAGRAKRRRRFSFRRLSHQPKRRRRFALPAHSISVAQSVLLTI